MRCGGNSRRIKGTEAVGLFVTDRDLTPPSAEDILRQVHQALGRWVGIKEVRFVQQIPTMLIFTEN